MNAILSTVGGQFFLDWPDSPGIACHIDYLRPALARILGFAGDDIQIDAATDYLYERVGNVIVAEEALQEYV
ncbi:MAG: hypothetical protein ACRC1W_01535 [Shewanella sp.]